MKNVLRFIRNPVNYPEYLEEANEHLRKLARRRLYSNPVGNTSQEIIVNQSSRTYQGNKKIRKKRTLLDMDLPLDVKLYAGFLFKSSPHRHKSSKFYVTLEEYPWAQWPGKNIEVKVLQSQKVSKKSFFYKKDYITAGCYIVSRATLFGNGIFYLKVVGLFIIFLMMHFTDIYYASMYTKIFRFDDIFLGMVAYKAKIDLLHSNEFYFYKTSPVTHSYKYVIASHGYGDHSEMIRVWNSNKMAGYA